MSKLQKLPTSLYWLLFKYSKVCFLFPCILLLFFTVTGCTGDDTEKPSKNLKPAYGYISPVFSPDNSKILFSLCMSLDKDYGCNLATYERSTNTLRVFNPTGNMYNTNPSYSWDGKMITFSSGNEREGDKGIYNANIYIMNANGTGLRQLTHNYNNKPVRDKDGDVILKYNVMPSFSPDGRRVIFKRARIWRKRSMGGKMLSHWDIYEIDIETKKERRLTNYRFYMMTRPYYLSDGKRFIFSGNGPKSPDNYPYPLPLREEYERKYQENTILIMDGIHNGLRAALTYGDCSSEPSVAHDDSILFIARTNKMDKLPGPYNYDLFIKKGSEIRRITKMESYITQASISPDGSRAIFIADTSKERGKSVSLWTVKTDGTGLTRIKLPFEQVDVDAFKGNKK